MAHQRAYQKEFLSKFSLLCQRRHNWRAWSDFIELVAISIANSLEHGNVMVEREKRYQQIIQGYTPKEQPIFSDLLQIMVDALEHDPEQDFLGAQFMLLELGNHWKGQYFTPYSLCKLMAQINLDGTQQVMESRGWISINDCCCGAGAMLIAARNALVHRSLGHKDALFVAQDIDRTAGLMCYIQLSLLGCAGYVVIADSLLHPVGGKSPLLPEFTSAHDVWYLPMFYHEKWQERIFYRHISGLLQMIRSPIK